MFKRIIVLFCLFTAISTLRAQDHPFRSGESLTYGIYYYLWGVWVGAGDVTFSVHDDTYLGEPCYRFKGFGKTYPRYDWFFKVRDTYEAYSSKSDLSPFRFHRDVSEGSFYFTEDNVYNYSDSLVYSAMRIKEKPMNLDTFNLLSNSFDVLSLVYQARTIDFDSKKKDEKIPIRMVIDQEIFDLYIRYLGVETYDHDDLGEVECYVFSPLLVEGTIFRSGEGMKVWVTKDKNMIPLYIESQIRVGSIRSELKFWKGLKSPMEK